MAAVGNTIRGRYKLVSIIGRGGMSTVFLAVDTKLGKQWAVKQIIDSSDSVKQDVVRRSLFTEMEMLKSLNHPAIPRIVDVFDEDGSYFVVRDYVDGYTLSSLIHDEGTFSEQNAVDWGVQLCDILNYLHRHNPSIIYRDLKPSNIMVTSEGYVRLIDFGIACEIDKDSGKVLAGDPRGLGTPGYASPEQLKPDPVIDIRDDIYSLGVTLYVLLTGINPRKSGIGSVREIRPEISIGLDNIICSATRTDPAQRFADCAEFAYALRHFNEQDVQYFKGLKKKWYTFICAIVAAVVFLAASGIFFGAAKIIQNNDFEYWMDAGDMSTTDAAAQEKYIKAAGIRPESIRPYAALIKRYTTNSMFTPDEERTLISSISDKASALQKDKQAWASLCYEVGKLYWYYYMPGSVMALQPSQRSEAAEVMDIQRERIIAARPWMVKAAAVENFKDRRAASVYRDIADFSSTITSRIDEGEDAGLYGPYFALLERLVKDASADTGSVIKIEAANMAAHAVITYGRDFRADHISKARMVKLIDGAQSLIDSVSIGKSRIADRVKAVKRNLDSSRQAVSDTFIDVDGKQDQSRTESRGQ